MMDMTTPRINTGVARMALVGKMVGLPIGQISASVRMGARDEGRRAAFLT